MHRYHLLCAVGLVVFSYQSWAASAGEVAGSVLTTDSLLLLRGVGKGNDDPWIRIPPAGGPVTGVDRKEAITLRIDKHNSSPSSGNEIKSGDAVALRGTAGKDAWIFVPRDGNKTITADEGGSTGKRSILVIRKVQIAANATISPDGTPINLGDYIILRDTAGTSNFRLHLEGIGKSMEISDADAGATPFRIEELAVPVPAASVTSDNEWVEVGWLNGPECVTLEWDNSGWLNLPSPTYCHSPQEWHILASYDKTALASAKSDITQCLISAGAATGLASIAGSPAAAAPTFNTSFITCANMKNIAGTLRRVPELKVDSHCT